jgi:hypothetical protein
MRAPEQGILGPLPSGVQLVKSGAADVVVFFAHDQSDLKTHLPEAMKAAKDSLWIAYPKIASGKADLSRQVVHDGFRLAGWSPVAQISIDDTWSAIRGRAKS